MKNPMTMNHAAQAAGISPSTLRYYEDKGVICPDRDSTGRRLFSDSDVKAVVEYRQQHSRGAKR